MSNPVKVDPNVKLSLFRAQNAEEHLPTKIYEIMKMRKKESSDQTKRCYET